MSGSDASTEQGPEHEYGAYGDWWLERAARIRAAGLSKDLPYPVHRLTDENMHRILFARWAWDEGLLTHIVFFRVNLDPAEVEQYLGASGVLEHWSRVLSTVAGLGWRLHTWSTGNFTAPDFEAHALFIRPD